MNEENSEMKNGGDVRDVIRNKLGSDTNRRFLARMNAFKLDVEIPDTFRALLSDLDRAESKR